MLDQHMSKVRRHFIDRLVARGYEPAFLQPIFDGVFYSDRWRYLTRRHAQSADATEICNSALIIVIQTNKYMASSQQQTKFD